jgi:uncharacterized membrane protein
MLVIPGYLLVTALFPGREDLHVAERIGLTFGLSFVIVAFVGLGLNYTPFGITSNSFLFSFAGLSIVVGLIALHRRSRLAAADRFVLNAQDFRVRRSTMDWSDKILLAISTLAVVLLVSGVTAILLRSGTGERFTEFYLLQSDERLSGYSSEVTVDQLVTVVLGIVNHEHDDLHYRIERVENATSEQVSALLLEHGETWEQPYSFALPELGEDQKIEFLLYKEGEQEPYRSVYLWVTVREE